MAGDERRAEVEAAVSELKYNDECGPGPVSEAEYIADAEAILAALDRLRDARGDDEAARGRALVDRMFELPRPGPEWEQALAELRAWSMSDWDGSDAR